MPASDLLSRLEHCDSLGGMLEESTRRHPRRKAILFGRTVTRYRELNASVNRIAHALTRRLGILPSDRVALLMGNDPRFIYACLGALKAGAVVVPLNTFLTAPELSYLLSDARAAVLITSDQFAPAVTRCAGGVPSLTALVTTGRESLGRDTFRMDELVAGMPDSDPACAARRSDLAFIIYTSGTTGRQKGAMLTHGNLLSNVAASGASIEIGRRDRVMLVLPMFHSFTLTACILMPLAVGGSIIVAERLRSLPQVARDLTLRRATIFIGIPHLYDVMAHRGIPWWLRPFMRLRGCISGSAPLPAATLAAFEKRVRIPLLEGYGLSETSPVVSINPLRGRRKPGSVGLPIPGVSVRIVTGEMEPLPPGRVGEIAVRGPNVMTGYLNHPRETKETIRDGWLLTGDIGMVDDDGYIFILDRKQDMILFHGMNVYPREVEEVLYRHPLIAEAAVVGRSDRHRGEIPVAFVSVKEGCRVKPSEIVAFCKQFLAAYKVPHRIIVVPKLPRTSTGKVLKRDLRRIAEKQSA